MWAARSRATDALLLLGHQKLTWNSVQLAFFLRDFEAREECCDAATEQAQPRDVVPIRK